MPAESKMSRRKIYITVTVIACLALVLFGGGQLLQKRGNTGVNAPVYHVQRGPLTISFVESGTIKARDQVVIKNEVEGRTSIITLVPEGTRVKKGELLVELDVSELEDDKVDQEIRVQNAEASYISAKENLAVVENQAQSDVDLATLELEFAKQDLQKYIDGEYPYELDQADAQITLAESELAQAQETLKWSKKLYEEKYISQTELQKDELSEKKKTLDVKLAQKSKELLTEYTYKRQLAQLQSDVSQAKMALERTERKARADVIQAQADLKAREAEYMRHKDRLAKIIDQINKTKIYAPADGLVIYATSVESGGWHGNDEPLEEGQEIRERENLIYLPTGSSVKAEIAIHETNLEKTTIGLPAIVTVDSLLEATFYGTVAQIAPLPDAQRMWMNPDLKVYNSEIYIDGNTEMLRTGRNCQAEIIIARYDDVISVPLQAVTRLGADTVVYVRKGKNFEPLVVKTGLDNNKMIHIEEGLEDKDVILLSPPLKSSAVTAGEKGGKNLQQKISDRLNHINNHSGRRDDQGPGRGDFQDRSGPDIPQGDFENSQAPAENPFRRIPATTGQRQPESNPGTGQEADR